MRFRSSTTFPSSHGGLPAARLRVVTSVAVIATRNSSVGALVTHIARGTRPAIHDVVAFAPPSARGIRSAIHDVVALAPPFARGTRSPIQDIVVLAPLQAEAWFALASLRQDRHDLAGAEAALREVLRVAPPRAEVECNLGIVLQEAGRLDEAMRAYGRALRLAEASFGRIAHALAAPGTGRLWLDLDALREHLRALPA